MEVTIWKLIHESRRHAEDWYRRQLNMREHLSAFMRANKIVAVELNGAGVVERARFVEPPVAGWRRDGDAWRMTDDAVGVEWQLAFKDLQIELYPSRGCGDLMLMDGELWLPQVFEFGGDWYLVHRSDAMPPDEAVEVVGDERFTIEQEVLVDEAVTPVARRPLLEYTGVSV